MIKINEEFKALIPPLTTEEFEQLERNILKEGIREPIIVWRVENVCCDDMVWNNIDDRVCVNCGEEYSVAEIIVDGHNRYEIATKHGLVYEKEHKQFDSRDKIIEWMILNQFGRRNLSAYQRSLLALKLKPVFEEKAKENQIRTSENRVCQKSDEQKVDTKKEIARVANVSHDTISKVQKIEEKATPEVKQQLSKGEISINQAYNDIKKEEKKQEFKANIEQQKKDIEEGKAILPTGVYEVISIDPPWNYGTQFDGDGRRVANPYPEMNQEQLKELKIPSADNSVIFLWTTQKFIWDAKELLDLWGYTYRATIVWDKEKIGMGDLFRMQCEFCLVGIKGKPIFDNNHTWRDIIKEPRREHSRKPEMFYEMVNSLCVGRKLDYFSREQRQGWEVFGNDTSKF